jgi:hypothetical protein
VFDHGSVGGSNKVEWRRLAGMHEESGSLKETSKPITPALQRAVKRLPLSRIARLGDRAWIPCDRSWNSEYEMGVAGGFRGKTRSKVAVFDYKSVLF